jgi:hypothetical protein
LIANCAGKKCGYGRKLDLDVLIERFGTDYEVFNEKRIAAACVCKRCGHRGASLHLTGNTTPNGSEKTKGGRIRPTRSGLNRVAKAKTSSED